MKEKIQKVESLNGISIYKIDSERFKTNTISIYFRDVLKKETVNYNALLPAVLRMGSKAYPTAKEVNSQLESLFGATFDCGIQKKGESHVMYFYIEFIDGKYTGSSENIFEKSFDFLYSMVFETLVINDSFDEEIVKREKSNVIDIIKSRINDKGHYAYERCIEEMCEGEPFGMYEYGNEEAISEITPKNLMNYYKKAKKELNIDIFIYGSSTNSDINHIVNKMKNIERASTYRKLDTQVKKVCSKVKEAGDSFDIKQGKLTMGFRTQVAASDKEYYSLMLMNSILGGGIHSKLFRNVREKEGLCYYASSNLEKFKGLMIISTGIDFINKEKVVNLALQQLNSIKNSDISDFELNSAAKYIKNSLNSLKDSPVRLLDFYFGQILSGIDDNLDDISKKCAEVKIEDIILVSKRICLDTVYFMGPNTDTKI
jgi:predicted Zn-dependent peptidase